MSSYHTPISKTDYMRYLECPLYGWLAKNKPELVEQEETLVMKQGNDVEALAHGLFKKGVEVKAHYEAGSEETMELIKKGEPVIYQAQAMTDKFLARTDILVKKSDGWHLYEVKGSTGVKDKYIHDIKFQANAFRLAGIDLKGVNLIYVNNEYVFDKKKGLDLKKLLVVEDLTKDIMEGADAELKEMEEAYKVLTGKERPKPLSLKKKFDYGLTPLMEQEYYKGVPEYSIYDIRGRFSHEKLDELNKRGIVELKDIPAGFRLNASQWRQINLTKKKGKDVDKKAIKAWLDKLKFPLYFLDYETIQLAIPFYDKTRPWQQIPLQYSLHVVDKPGEKAKHFEFLHTDKSSPFEPIAKTLREHIGDKGTVIAWNSQFEAGRDKEIGEMAPRYRDFMADMNRRMVDIKLIFKAGYMDYRFNGSVSLKAVLPVLAPKLSYTDLEIQGGGGASEALVELVFGNGRNKETIKKQLLEYCGRDSYAMVVLWEFLRRI
jgi:hypothetical protein